MTGRSCILPEVSEEGVFHQMSVVHLSVGAVWRLVRVVCNAFPFLSVFCVVRIFLSFISKTPSLLIKLTILSFSRALHGGVYFQGIIFEIDQPTFGKRSCFLAVLVCLCHSYGQKCLWFHMRVIISSSIVSFTCAKWGPPSVAASHGPVHTPRC